jgi:hypothetical protein
MATLTSNRVIETVKDQIASTDNPEPLFTFGRLLPNPVPLKTIAF